MKPLMIHSPSFVATALAKIAACACSMRRNLSGVILAILAKTMRHSQSGKAAPVQFWQHLLLETAVRPVKTVEGHLEPSSCPRLWTPVSRLRYFCFSLHVEPMPIDPARHRQTCYNDDESNHCLTRGN